MANNSTIGAAGDYATIALWEGDTDNDLVTATAGENGQLLAEVHTFSASTRIDGATTDATYFRTLQAASGASHAGVFSTSGTCAAIVITAANIRLEINEANAVFEDLVLARTDNSNGTTFFWQLGSATAFEMRRCFVVSDSDGGEEPARAAVLAYQEFVDLYAQVWVLALEGEAHVHRGVRGLLVDSYDELVAPDADQ